MFFVNHDCFLMFRFGCSVHHALRASTAAPGYFETCVLDERPGDRFQDGGLLANNPAAIGLHEAMRLWPTRNVDVIVSFGTGRGPFAKAANEGLRGAAPLLASEINCSDIAPLSHRSCDDVGQGGDVGRSRCVVVVVVVLCLADHLRRSCRRTRGRVGEIGHGNDLCRSMLLLTQSPNSPKAVLSLESDRRATVLRARRDQRPASRRGADGGQRDRVGARRMEAARRCRPRAQERNTWRCSIVVKVSSRSKRKQRDATRQAIANQKKRFLSKITVAKR